MKILVFSDSHGKTSDMISVISKFNDVEKIIHLGDYDCDVDDIKHYFPKYDVISVSGNCDYGSLIPTEKMVLLNNKSFFLCHGNTYNVNFNYDRISYTAQEKKADICLYGHTHVPLLEKIDNLIVLNPGSITSPRTNDKMKSFGIIEVDNNGIINVTIEGIYNDKLKVLYRR